MNENTNEQNQVIAPGHQPVAPAQPVAPEQPAASVAPAPAPETIAPAEPVQQPAAPAEVTPAPVAPEQPMAPVPPVMQPVESVPVAEQPKTGKKPVGLIVLIAVIAVAIIGFFTVRAVLTSPKNVFKAAINETYKAMSNVIETVDEKFQIGDKAVEITGTVKVDSSFEEIKQYGMDKLEFNGTFGIDPKNKELLLTLGTKGESEKIEGTAFVKEGYTYLKTSFYDQIIKLGTAGNIDFNSMKEIFDQIDKTEVDPKLYDSIIEAFTNAVSESLDKDAMSKKSTKIEIAGKKYSVTKNSYRLNEKQTKKLSKAIINNLLKDDEFIKNVSKASSVEEKEIRKSLEESLKEVDQSKFEETTVINIYTKGLFNNNMVGIDITEGKEETFSYYGIDGNIELSLGEDLKLIVENKGKQSEAKIMADGSTVATATIRSFTKERIDFDYEIPMTTTDPSMTGMKGSILLTTTETKNSISGEYKFRIGYNKDHLEVSGTYGIESKDRLSGLDVSKAVDSTEADQEAFMKGLTDTIAKDPALTKAKQYVESIISSMQQPSYPTYDDGYEIEEDDEDWNYESDTDDF